MNTMKKIFIGILIATLLCCTTAFAQSSVTYDGNAQEFVYAPGSEYSPTDLFENYKGVMPGDKLSQQILVKNDADKKVDVKLYMRSLGAVEGSEDFLGQLNLTVMNDTTELFDAPAADTAQLTDWVLLGTFKSGAEVALDVTLDVPIELGSDAAAQIGYLDWEFKAEEIPIEEEGPKTGDSSNLVLWIAILAVCIAACVIAAVVMKKRRTNEE